MTDDFTKVARSAMTLLPLEGATLGREYYYNSLSLCVIDAVFSIGVRYESVRAVVRRYCQRFQIDSTARSSSSCQPRRRRKPWMVWSGTSTTWGLSA